MAETYYAHSANKNGLWESAKDHAADVAECAATFATKFGGQDEARLAGLLHDAGKWTDLFQKRLRGTEQGLDHWSIGAWTAVKEFLAPAVTAVIQGHHTGLKALTKTKILGLEPARLVQNHPDCLRLTSCSSKEVLDRILADGLRPTKPALPFYGTQMQDSLSAMLDVRMLFSALVDADYLETEAHFEAAPGSRKTRRSPGPPLSPNTALELVHRFIAERADDIARRNAANKGVLDLRSQLLQDCTTGAASRSGLFTLTAPTGSGKTLSMLVFALAHAKAHQNQFERVVVVIPYLSIIEQTVAVFRSVFGDQMSKNYVLEDHSLSGLRCDPVGEGQPDNGDPARAQARRLAENWDAPLIVTTSVQMLESLFANRPGACRKLHRLARSVILFDEVQTLPLALAVPTLKALAHLSARYGSTVVFATATQPAFAELDREVKKETPYSQTGSGRPLRWQPREIVSDVPGLFGKAKRTTIPMIALDRRVSWSELADQIAGEEQALCVVNLKRHALEVLDLLTQANVDGLFHLSTNMCPAHRRQVLDAVRLHLDEGRPCRLVSTQCVEAGVDVDFPVVYRAFAPLDAIAQAAGRCNRNGKRASGQVHVFLPEDDGKQLYPSGGYEQAATTLEILLKELGPAWLDIDDPACFARYYKKLYSVSRPELQKKDLSDAIKLQDFAKVAELYRIISQDALNVLVPFDLPSFREQVQEAKQDGLSGHWIKTARPQVVSIFRPKSSDSAVWTHIENVPLPYGDKSTDWFFCRNEDHYDRQLRGLCLPDSASVYIA